MIALALKPPSSKTLSDPSMTPLLQVAGEVSEAEISTRSLASISSKLTVPLASRFCAEASASYVKPKSATSLIVGPSLLPVPVIVTVCSALAKPLLSVAV